MQNKHPLETILEDLLAAIPARGAVKKETREAAVAALEKWRATPQAAPDAELTDLRAMKEAVRKALTWGPTTPATQTTATVLVENMITPSLTPTNWQKAKPILQPSAESIENLPQGYVPKEFLDSLPPGVVRAQPVRPSISSSVAAAVAGSLPPGVVQAQRVVPQG